MRQGNTASALNSMVGPDAAINYLQAMRRVQSDLDDGSDDASYEPTEVRWPPNAFVTTVAELFENVSSTPPGVRLHVARIDRDGDAVVEAVRLPRIDLGAWLTGEAGDSVSAAEPERFWVKAELLGRIDSLASALRRCSDLASEIEQRVSDP